MEKSRRLRIGAVRYLNARPLTRFLSVVFPEAEVVMDYPSRLAEGLRRGAYDVGLIPLVEHLRSVGTVILGDTCIAGAGRVHSVILHARRPLDQIRSLALDEGSRSSAALCRVLLAEVHGVYPRLVPFPVDAVPDDCDTDAVLVMGDRAMATTGHDSFASHRDVGQWWTEAIGHPFVYAAWVAGPSLMRALMREGSAGNGQPDADRVASLASRLSEARDRGLAVIDEIAREGAATVGRDEAFCRRYLRESLRYRLGDDEKAGMRRFVALATKHGVLEHDVAGYEGLLAH